MLVWMMLGLVACTGENNDNTTKPSLELEDTGDDEISLPEWAIYIFMNGDNDLESYVFYDLNELEEVGSSDSVHIVVQADRSDGYWTGDGDWSETRRYYIEQDNDPNTVSSEMVMSVGEADMGSSEDLADFLSWAYAEYPAQNVAVIFWNHGEAWSKGSPPPYISWDEGSGNVLSFAKGDVAAGLAPLVEQHGPIEIVGFDACYMGSWEVAHSLSYQAQFMAGAETVVGMDGYHYPFILEGLNAEPDMGAKSVVQLFAESAGSINQEWTHAAYDLGKIADLDVALNQVSDVFLENPDLKNAFLELRSNAAGADGQYHDYFLDLGDFGVQLQSAQNTSISEAGAALNTALSSVVLSSYNNSPFDDIQGLSIFADTSGSWSENYGDGAGATWAEATRWDDWILSLEP